MRDDLLSGLGRVKFATWGTVFFGCLCGWVGATITITPTYVDGTGVDGTGESWTIARKAVFEQAVSDWQDVLEAPAAEGSVTINVTVTFTNAGSGGYLGQWQGNFDNVVVGDSTRPWLKTTHVIRFNEDLMTPASPGDNYLWWDSTPTTSTDQPFEAWDALSVARHEIGHMLGFSSTLYRDNAGQANEVLLWRDRVTFSGSDATFDQGGLNVAMESSSNYTHIADAAPTEGDLMVVALPNNARRDISATNTDMLALAYDYVQIPEPRTTVLFALILLGGILRRRRVA